MVASRRDQVPNTIDDETWRNLRARAERAAPPMFSREATLRRQQGVLQQQKAEQS